MLEVGALRYGYGADDVLRIDALIVSAGQSLAVIGPSGSGKTTLLHLLAGLIRPRAGTISVAGQVLRELSGAALDRFRGRTIGFVPQRLHLLPSLDVRGNLRLARYLAGLPADDAAIDALLKTLSISHRARARPAELSQGEAQRAAIARAVVNRPKLLLADEPTANLDDANAAAAIDLIEGQARDCGAALVIATHDGRVRGRIANTLSLGAAR